MSKIDLNDVVDCCVIFVDKIFILFEQICLYLTLWHRWSFMWKDNFTQTLMLQPEAEGYSYLIKHKNWTWICLSCKMFCQASFNKNYYAAVWFSHHCFFTERLSVFFTYSIFVSLSDRRFMSASSVRWFAPEKYRHERLPPFAFSSSFLALV